MTSSVPNHGNSVSHHVRFLPDFRVRHRYTQFPNEKKGTVWLVVAPRIPYYRSAFLKRTDRHSSVNSIRRVNREGREKEQGRAAVDSRQDIQGLYGTRAWRGC